MLVHSLVTLLMKSRERLACEVLDPLATRAGLVHGITDTDCWAQNSSTSDSCVTVCLSVCLSLSLSLNS